jgi:hypothetical protein
MQTIITTVKVVWGLMIISVCIVGLAVIMKADTRKEKQDERIKRSYLYYRSGRHIIDD